MFGRLIGRFVCRSWRFPSAPLFGGRLLRAASGDSCVVMFGPADVPRSFIVLLLAHQPEVQDGASVRLAARVGLLVTALEALPELRPRDLMWLYVVPAGGAHMRVGQPVRSTLLQLNGDQASCEACNSCIRLAACWWRLLSNQAIAKSRLLPAQPTTHKKRHPGNVEDVRWAVRVRVATGVHDFSAFFSMSHWAAALSLDWGGG